MIYKLDNGGIVKLQNAGSIPEYNDIEQIAKYNREHGTNFWKMSQVLEHDKQQAQQKTQNKKKSFWEILAGHPESAGEAILNKTIETANNAELPETRKKIYNDTAKSELSTTAGSILTLPMLGEFSTYGLLGGSARLAGGFGGSAVGSYTLGKAGELGDRTFGTTWMKPTGQVIGGFASWVPGSNIAYKGALDLASKVPSIARIGATKQFVGDVAGRALNKNINGVKFYNTPVFHGTDYVGNGKDLKPYSGSESGLHVGTDRSPSQDIIAKMEKPGTIYEGTYTYTDYTKPYKLDVDPGHTTIWQVGNNSQVERLKAASPIFRNDGSYVAEKGAYRKQENDIGRQIFIDDGIHAIEYPNRIEGNPGNKSLALMDKDSYIFSKNRIFTPTSQKSVSTVHFDPRVKPLSRPSASKIAIDTDERFLSGQNLLYSLDGTSIGPTIDAHGISKGLTSQQLDQLEQILNSGISKNIYTAPLARINGVGSALGTSSGTAYTDGMFIVAGKPGKSLHDGIDTILINSADENYAQALKTYYSNKYPNFNFITYNEAPAHYGVEKKIIPEVKVTTTPTKTNAINKLDINELPPPPEEVNIVLKQGGILKAQNGVPSFVTPMTNQFTTKLMEFLEKYRRKGPAPQKAIGPAVWAYNKPSKIADDGGKIS